MRAIKNSTAFAQISIAERLFIYGAFLGPLLFAAISLFAVIVNPVYGEDCVCTTTTTTSTTTTSTTTTTIPVVAKPCSNRIQLIPALPTDRTPVRLLYKSAWNKELDMEQTPEEGNHAYKGAGFLIDYRAKQYIPNQSYLEVRSLACKLVARFGRYPRCTSTGCGTWERWYLRAPGGTNIPVSALVRKLGSTQALIQLKGGQWAQVQDLYDLREQKK